MLESECEDAILERDSYFLTEFFNDSIDDVVRLTENATGRVGCRRHRRLLPSGEELEAGVRRRAARAAPERRELGQGTAAELVLWEVSAPVRVEGVDGPPAARRGFCLELPA